MNIFERFSPSALDVVYERLPNKISLILRTDSYKFSHSHAHRPGVKGMIAYGTSRVPSSRLVTFWGAQILLNKYFMEPITMEDIQIAEEFTQKHLGRNLIVREDFELIVNEYGGYFPLCIRTVDEGVAVPGGMPQYTVSSIDPDTAPQLAYLVGFTETVILRGVWYTSTIVTLDREVKAEIKRLYEISGADTSVMLGFSLHDFGGRGVTCPEQAENGGAAHTVNFPASDTVEGVVTANNLYASDMAAFSVYATEHSIECIWGLEPENEIEYIKHQVLKAKELGLSIVSIVIDGKDVYRATKAICNELRELIIESGVKVVLRPDSGDMMDIVPWILDQLGKAFGTTLNSKGFKNLKHVGVIQGDGIDRLTLISLLGKIVSQGWSADVMVFGSGGGLLQKVDRDTLKYAQKVCAWYDGEKWIPVMKDPITDSGKKSLEGVVSTITDGTKYDVIRYDLGQEVPEGWKDMLRVRYYAGKLYNAATMESSRTNVA